MFSNLRNLYWHIRDTRNSSKKRKYYRYIEKEKKRLIEETGVDSEELRLLCRALSSKITAVGAEKRLLNHLELKRHNQSFYD